VGDTDGNQRSSHGKLLMAFQARAEAEAGRKLGTLCTDRGGEFMTHAFIDHCIKEGIQ
jgi:hypothetical protein